jgi:hypothetical protein
MQFVSEHGMFFSFSVDETTQTPDEIYSAWCADEGVSETLNQLGGLNGDDGAYLVSMQGRYVMPASRTDRIGFSTEGSFEFFNSPPAANASRISISIPGVSRMYSTAANIGRVGMTFHPPYDAWSDGVLGVITDEFMIMKGSITRSGKPPVYFAARFVFGISQEIYFLNKYSSSVPIYIFDISPSNSISNRQTITTLPANADVTTRVSSNYSIGTMQGTVIDEAGNPAVRRVRIHDRESGRVVGEADSGEDGMFTIEVYAVNKGPFYVIAFDDDDAPDLNALIFDRVMLP